MRIALARSPEIKEQGSTEEDRLLAAALVLVASSGAVSVTM